MIGYLPAMASTFLKAEWRRLAMANYAIDPEILRPLVPTHTELDMFAGKCYVSLVGFLFVDVRLKGVPVPFHRNFEEVNLRFYVRHFDGKSWKRGVVFVREIVPKSALSLVARTFYGEPYVTRLMDHLWQHSGAEISVEYSWLNNRRANVMQVTALPEPVDILAGSAEEFITEHYWGYTARKRELTSEYEVKHPKWQVYPVTSHKIDVDFAANYGERFEMLDNLEPESVFLAEGSAISVHGGRTLKL